MNLKEDDNDLVFVLLTFALGMLALSLLGCTPYGSKVQVEPERPNMDGVLRLVGRFGIAHACPFDSGQYAWTSAHVVDLRPFDDTRPFGARWEDGIGESGTLEVLYVLRDSDLALIARNDGKKWDRAYPSATEPPKPGDRIHIEGYSYKNKRTAFGPQYHGGEVLRVLADNLVLDENSRQGSSGGCVLNDRGEVVALPTWGPIHMDNQEQVAIAVGVWSSIDNVQRVIAEADQWRLAQEKAREIMAQ